MAAVVRVKRYLSEEPSETLVINCKRRKTEIENETSELSAVLTFAGTIKSQDEDIFSHLKKPSKEQLESHYKKRNIVDINSKLRAQKQEDSKENRYKVVNCFRSQNGNKSDDSSDKKDEKGEEVIVYDIESENHPQGNSKVETDNKETNYVYDLYYTTSDDLGDGQLSEYISVYPLSDELVFGSARDNGFNALDSDRDSEDSNAENDWRNDYPDEDEMDSSVCEDDMIAAMKRVDLSDDLSSDDGEEGFVYSIDSEAAGFEEDIDDSDEHRYGERFARLMRRHRKEQNVGISSDLYYGDIEDDDEDLDYD